jgi:hypothetical protein
MALPKIEPLGTEFDMPQGGDNSVQREITRLGEVIIDKTSVGLKAATQAVIGDVPKMIQDLTNEIESGPVDNFAIAIRKLIKLVDDLGINLRDYNNKLADTVEEFTGNQQKLENQLGELREKGIKAEINEKGNAINILTQKEIKAYEKDRERNEKSITELEKQIQTRITTLNQLDETDKKGRKEIEKEIKTRSENIEGLKEENEQINKRVSTTADTGGQDQGFGKLAEIREAFMVIPDTITEVATSFANVGKSVFGFIKMFKEPMKAFKSIGASLGAIGNIFKTARILIALKVLAVVAAIQFFAEKIDSIGNFFVGIWEKITGFFQGIVDWFKNSTVGKFFFGGDDEEEKQLGNRDPKAGTAGDIAGEASFADFDDGNAPVRNMSSARLEDGLEVTQTNLSDFDDNSANIIAQRQMAGMDGTGNEEIDYTGIRGGTSLSQLGIKDRDVVGNQMQNDSVSELLKQLDQENASFSTPNVTNIQNNSNVNSQQTSGTTVSGFVDHEPDTSFKYIRSGASGSDEF